MGQGVLWIRYLNMDKGGEKMSTYISDAKEEVRKSLNPMLQEKFDIILQHYLDRIIELNCKIEALMKEWVRLSTC